jgi:hypothetical protein
MSIKVKLRSQDNLIIKSQVRPSSINELNNIDVSDNKDGSVLVFSQTTGKWTSTLLLEKQTIECGQY